MTILETLEREFHVLLDTCGVIRWKELELEELIKYAHMEKEYWADRKRDYAVNNMIRIIEMAESLNKLREESNTL